MSDKKICKICNKEFIAKHGRQLYCSDRCGIIARRKSKRKSYKRYLSKRCKLGLEEKKDYNLDEETRRKKREAYYRNRENRLARGKEYYQKHKEKWRLKYKSFTFRERIIGLIKKRGDKIECAACGYSNEKILVTHHIVPISEGGTNRLDNIVLLCPTCHTEIHSEKYKDEVINKIINK